MSDRQKEPSRHHKPSFFTAFANHTARAAGHHLTFTLAVLVIVGWGITGPIFDYSDTWQLIINTGTTIVTFMMVFLIQNTQNRDSIAMHLKLDEIIRALDGAQNSFLNVEELEDDDLEAIHQRYRAMAQKAQNALDRDEVEEAVAQLEMITTAKQGGSARTKKRAERNRKRG